MNAPGPYYSRPRIPGRALRGHFHWVAIAIALVLIGGTVLLLVFLFPSTFGLTTSTSPYRYGVFGGFFFLFFLLILVFFVARVAFWGARMGRRRGYGAGYGGQYGPDRPAGSPAFDSHEARSPGNSTDQIMDGLSRRPGPP